MASRLLSVRRSVHRNWGCADIGVCVAREGSHTIGEKVNSISISSQGMASWPRKKERTCWWMFSLEQAFGKFTVFPATRLTQEQIYVPAGK